MLPFEVLFVVRDSVVRAICVPSLLVRPVPTASHGQARVPVLLDAKFPRKHRARMHAANA